MIQKYHKYFENKMRSGFIGKTYFHGSVVDMTVGTILVAGDLHNEGMDELYRILEKYRSNNKLPHSDSLFMCDKEGDLDFEGSEYLFTVEALGPVTKHDRNWLSEVSKLHGERSDERKIKKAAENYWSGIPYRNVSTWEYITPEARVLSSEPY